MNAYDKADQLESTSGATFTTTKRASAPGESASTGPATTYAYDLTAVERPEEGEPPAIAETFTYDGTGLLGSLRGSISDGRVLGNGPNWTAFEPGHGDRSDSASPSRSDAEAVAAGLLAGLALLGCGANRSPKSRLST